MDPKNILLLGVKRSVTAFEKTTGRRIWSTQLYSGFGDPFVSILADDQHVFAHGKGELYCLDLFNGRILWKDGLTGMGYGLAAMAIPGGPQNTLSIIAEKHRQDNSNSSSSTSSSGT